MSDKRVEIGITPEEQEWYDRVGMKMAAQARCHVLLMSCCDNDRDCRPRSPYLIEHDLATAFERKHAGRVYGPDYTEIPQGGES